MKLHLIAFTERGCRLLCELKQKLNQSGHNAEGYAFSASASLFELQKAESLDAFTKQAFTQADGIIFIGACGIAVRAIAPFLKDKTSDPAVVVVDEYAKYAISILSGHIGGANTLTNEVASLCSAQAVVTTATDLNDCFAVDNWAMKNRLLIQNPSMIKAVSSALLAGKSVGFFSEFKLSGDYPKGMVSATNGEVGICVSEEEKVIFDHTLWLKPRTIALGIGCRKDVPESVISKTVMQALTQAGYTLQDVFGVFSVERKAKEQGILDFCAQHHLEFHCFSAEELLKVSGEFSSSEFVQSVLGVDNVCERSAVLGSGGKLLLKKFAQNGVTVALSSRNLCLSFDKRNKGN